MKQDLAGSRSQTTHKSDSSIRRERRGFHTNPVRKSGKQATMRITLYLKRQGMSCSRIRENSDAGRFTARILTNPATSQHHNFARVKNKSEHCSLIHAAQKLNSDLVRFRQLAGLSCGTVDSVGLTPLCCGIINVTVDCPHHWVSQKPRCGLTTTSWPDSQ